MLNHVPDTDPGLFPHLILYPASCPQERLSSRDMFLLSLRRSVATAAILSFIQYPRYFHPPPLSILSKILYYLVMIYPDYSAGGR
jgi:hypothetical protein